MGSFGYYKQKTYEYCETTSRKSHKNNDPGADPSFAGLDIYIILGGPLYKSTKMNTEMKKVTISYRNFGDWDPFFSGNCQKFSPRSVCWLQPHLCFPLQHWNSQQPPGCTGVLANEAWPLSFAGSILCLQEFSAVAYFILFEKPKITVKNDRNFPSDACHFIVRTKTSHTYPLSGPRPRNLY